MSERAENHLSKHALHHKRNVLTSRKEVARAPRRSTTRSGACATTSRRRSCSRRARLTRRRTSARRSCCSAARPTRCASSSRRASPSSGQSSSLRRRRRPAQHDRRSLRACTRSSARRSATALGPIIGETEELDALPLLVEEYEEALLDCARTTSARCRSSRSAEERARRRRPRTTSAPRAARRSATTRSPRPDKAARARARRAARAAARRAADDARRGGAPRAPRARAPRRARRQPQLRPPSAPPSSLSLAQVHACPARLGGTRRGRARRAAAAAGASAAAVELDVANAWGDVDKSSVEELRRKGSATRQANRERWWKARVVVKHVFKHRTAVREGETKAPAPRRTTRASR